MRRVDPGNPTAVAPQKGTYVIRTVAKGQRLPTPVRPTGTRLQVVQPQAIRQEAAPEVINIDDEDEPECVTEKTVNASTIQHRIVPTVGPGATGTPGTKLVRVSEHGGRVFIAHVQPQNQPRFIRRPIGGHRIVPTVGPGATGTPGTKLVRVSEHGGRVFIAHVQPQNQPRFIRRPIGGVRYYTAGTVRAVEPRRFLQPDELRLKDSPIGGYDPEFQRIEASLRRAETEKRKELESQRLSCLTSYQSRGTELPEQARKLVQQLFNAPSNLNLSPNDDQEAKVIKNILNDVVTKVCNMDKENGWHREILRKARPNILNDVVTKVCNMDKENGWHREILRKARPVDILNAAPKTGVQVKRPNFRAVEALVTEKMEVLRKHIAKKRAKFELDVEFENHFIKRTRSGAVSCVPYAQTYARIGWLIFFKIFEL
uniref:Uncharacterized protein n=1 Tax=Panagrolaimus sp. JU765 TaxID=591449 RepID=A0AC34R128_9BILA